VNEGDKRSLLKTPLAALHRQLGARMVPFAGYAMPVQYERGIIAEHLHAREAAALFDVSHMGQIRLHGDDAAGALETLVPGDLRELAAGKARYTLFTNDKGGILDDLMVTRHGDHLFLVVNAACKAADLAHVRKHIGGRCTVEELAGRALLALQGPKAAAVLGRLAPPSRHMLFMSSESLRIGDVACLVTRSGYTGEDGFEISVAAEEAEELARMFLHEPEVKAAGLGARDSLRLEAGLCLYGNDIDETTTPVEAGLAWTIGKRRRAEGGFPGAGVILEQIRNGPPRARVGFLLDGKAPARAHAKVTDKDGGEIGEVTSGGFSPSLGRPIAIGYVGAAFAKEGTPVHLWVRGKSLAARVARLPFVPHRYFTG
jgi:aminomethyltransferase